jgi:hypothetical protein
MASFCPAAVCVADRPCRCPGAVLTLEQRQTRAPYGPPDMLSTFTVSALPGRLRVLSVFHSESVLYGAFVRARRALGSPKRRFPARAVSHRRGRAQPGLRGAPRAST